MNELWMRIQCSLYALVLRDDVKWPLRAILTGGLTPWGGVWVNGDGQAYLRYSQVSAPMERP